MIGGFHSPRYLGFYLPACGICHTACTGVCFQAPVPQGLQFQSSAAGAPFCHAFYEDHLQETSNQQSVDVPYSSIAHLVETRTHFYLMTAANQGMIIIKNNCSAELIHFLQGLKQ